MAFWPYKAVEDSVAALMSLADTTLRSLPDRDVGTFKWCLPVSLWNSNRGLDLLNPGQGAAGLDQIIGFQALGVDTVHIAANWPIMDPAYSASYASLRAFYEGVIAAAHAAGVRVALETGIMSASQALGSGVDYSGYTLAQILAGMRDHAVRLAPFLQAGDYIGFGAMEPFAFAYETGKTYSVADYTAHITDTLAALASVLPAGVTTTAGSGSNDDPAYVTAALGTTIGALDVHHYPMATLTNNLWTAFITMIDAAHAAGKPTVALQASCYKASPSEVTLQSPSFSDVFARDNWARMTYLDRRWLRLIHLMGQKKRLDLVSFFWPALMWSEGLPYDDTTAAYSSSVATTTVFSDALVQQAANNPSPTGELLQRLASRPRTADPTRTAAAT